MKTTKQVGRPRTAPVSLPIFDSMSALQGATGIPIHIQKKAKAAGCPAFRATRIHLAELLKWLFANNDGDETASDWDKLFKKCRAQREQIRLLEARHHVVTREWVGDIVAKAGERQRKILEPHVTPPVLAEICGATQPIFDDLVKQGDGGLPNAA